mmetsp:Transcript_68392/g.198254  ORF Transcript_68392/g.198254 Transcript_68392/m.198254 type:complete len:335 (-) Transcript_68392:241-1245(-)
MAAPPASREDARVRNLRKRLAQIGVLEDRCRSGEDLTTEQRSKLARRPEVEEELRRLLEGGEPSAAHDAEGAAAVAPPPADAVEEPSACLARSPVLAPQHEDSEGVSPVNSILGGSLSLGGPPILRRQHSGHWEDDPIAVEDLAPPSPHHKPRAEAEILQEVQPFAPATRACPRMRRLVRAISILSIEAFESDVLETVTKKGKFKLTVLALPDNEESEQDPWGGLLGFIAYKVKSEAHCVCIAKLAVVPEQRGCGHGHKLVQWCIDMSRHRRDIVFLSLSSLPAAIRFYKHLGFRQVDVDLSKLDANADDGEELIDGQIYMEYKCRARPCTKKK